MIRVVHYASSIYGIELQWNCIGVMFNYVEYAGGCSNRLPTPYTTLCAVYIPFTLPLVMNDNIGGITGNIRGKR